MFRLIACAHRLLRWMADGHGALSHAAEYELSPADTRGVWAVIGETLHLCLVHFYYRWCFVHLRARFCGSLIDSARSLDVGFEYLTLFEFL